MAARTRARGKPDRHVILVGHAHTRAAWRRFEQVGLRPELDLDELVLNWSERKVRDLEARGAITAVQIEATLEGAPTVTINLRDPDRHVFRRRYGRTRERKRRRRAGPVQVDEGWDAILPPDVLGRPMQVSLDGVTYQLVKAQYAHGSGELVLTFEHELVYLLKRHKGAKHAPREKVTRAQFILALLRELEPELRRRRYRFVCPELNVRQPIDKGQRQRSPSTARTTATSSGGSGSGRSLDRVYPQHKAGERGVRFTPEQVRACAAAGGFWGQELTAMEQIAHGESDYYPGVVSFDGGYGLWQMTPRVWGAEGRQWLAELGGMRALTNPIVNAKLARKLYENAGKSFSPWYGIRYLTVGSGPGNGRPSRAASRELAATVTEGAGGSPEGTASTRTVTETKSYQFARARGESSWTAIGRLAGEVKWRAFVVGNSVYYMSEETLYGRRARYQVGPDHDAVLDLAYDVDWGKPVSEASLNVTLARWGAPPGSVVALEGFGPPDGRWLVASVSRDYFQPTAEVKLLQPGKAALEPANEQTTRTVRTPGTGGTGGPGSGKTTGVWPGKFPISGAYGTNRGDHIHAGLDVGVPSGTSCIAPFDGTITHVSSSGFGTAGGMVHVRADAPAAGLERGDKVGWGHCVSPRVSVGDKVQAGKVVAKSDGSPAHVHFVLLKRGGGGNGVDGNTDPSSFLRRVGSI